MTRQSHSGHDSFSRSYRAAYDVDSDAESFHQSQIDAAYEEHDRVRRVAVDALHLAKLEFEKLRLQESAENERARLRKEQEIADYEATFIALRKQHIPVPQVSPQEATPRLPLPTPATIKPSTPVKAAPPKPPNVPQKASSPSSVKTKAPEPESIVEAPKSTIPPPPRQPALPKEPIAPAPEPSIRKEPSTPRAPAVDDGESGDTAPHLLPGIQRYKEIHQLLKKVRKWVVEDSKTNPDLKGKVGDMRRAIRVSIGQLTDVRGANKEPVRIILHCNSLRPRADAEKTARIFSVLKESLSLPSSPFDPSLVMVTPPAPGPGGPNDQIPILFIYILSILSKTAISQFIDEAGVNPKAAEPIGVLVVSVFARSEFQWREKPLIDILMAKFRIVCPVVFGIRGNDKTEEGRARQGWWKEGGRWIPDQTHNTRMTGLGAGYSAIALRDFSRTKMRNPWPPFLWWRSLASIVDTPEPSGTQYLVVKAMIDGYEQKFLGFYGSAGRAALKCALVDFPARDPKKTVAGSSLATLADKLKKDVGLRLI